MGVLGQLFSHEFDAINQLLRLGIPDIVSTTGGQYYYTEFGDMPDMLHGAFEYRKKGITLTYSANLTSSKVRERTIYGTEAFMELGGILTMTPDGESKKYMSLFEKGLVASTKPMLKIKKGSSLSSSATSLNSDVDAVSRATSSYYSSRGLSSTNIDGREWDVTHLHLKEWLDCIRNGGKTSANIDMAIEEGITIAMAQISYREQCRTSWDPVNKKILRL